ncbi:hypothetical protein JOL62DRAFT_586335 [Phyllosticta paracitricarpa]|uniref:Adenosine deaminase domain-containing protein n=2 Tax=Phyllosticta TaxID=121621 RepID=A0ABR1MUS9_9PEZI
MRHPSGKRKRETAASEERAKAGKSAQMDASTNGGPNPTLRLPTGNATKHGDQDWQDVVKENQEAFQQCFEDPGLKDSVQNYQTTREELLKDLEPRCWDYTARTNASEVEQKAAKIVQRIREDERINLFGNVPSEAIPGPTARDMGGQFLTNKSRIEESKLFDIAKQMPKGAHLHAHFNAELDVSDLLKRARDLDTMFIRATRPLLEPQDYLETEMVFTVLPTDHPEADPFSNDYNPDWKSPGSNPWVKWKAFQAKFLEKRPTNLGDMDAETWVWGKMVLGEEEVYGTKQTLNGIWARFNQATRCFKGLLNYESAYREYVRLAMLNMVKNKVMYAELRPMLLDKALPTDDGHGKIDLKRQMEIVTEEIHAFKAALGETDIHKFPFGLKIIYCTPRSIPKERMRSELADCIALKEEFPDLICGFDLVGAEDRPNHIGFYAEELRAFMSLCEKKGLSIPFMFHAGETLLDTGGSPSSDPHCSNLYEAVLLNSKRVGHGFSLLKHPRGFVDKFKANGICIELCPVSNEMLGLCQNVKQHPYPEILAAGIPCTVNADNPALFQANMSHEFYQVMVGDPTMSVHGWRQLAEWSLQHSCLAPEQVEQGLKYWKDSWEEFCSWVVKTYGDE